MVAPVILPERKALDAAEARVEQLRARGGEVDLQLRDAEAEDEQARYSTARAFAHGAAALAHGGPASPEPLRRPRKGPGTQMLRDALAVLKDDLSRALADLEVARGALRARCANSAIEARAQVAHRVVELQDDLKRELANLFALDRICAQVSTERAVLPNSLVALVMRRVVNPHVAPHPANAADTLYTVESIRRLSVDFERDLRHHLAVELGEAQLPF